MRKTATKKGLNRKGKQTKQQFFKIYKQQEQQRDWTKLYLYSSD